MQTGLTAAQLARMREQVAGMLPDVCVIQAATYTSDGAGGWTESYQAVTGGTVACRLDPLGARTRAETDAAQESQKSFYELTVPYGASLAMDRVVLVGGVRYDIAELHGAESWAVTRTARLTRSTVDWGD